MGSTHEISELAPFYDDLNPEQRTFLAGALASDPELSELFMQWRSLRRDLADRLGRDVPDRHLLVLYALDFSGRRDDLTPAELSRLEQARPALERAMERSPALVDVAADIVFQAAQFDRVWNAHYEEDSGSAERRAQRPVSRPARRRTWAWRAAAGAAVLFFGVLALFMFSRDASVATLELAAGETRTVELIDGTSIRLTGPAVLAYPTSEAAFNRQVRLEGRAFFDVAPDEVSFTVATPTARATVLGTTFGVTADERHTEVVLATGKVAVASVSAPERIVVLEPGQMTRVEQGALPSTPEAIDVSDALTWTGLFVFQATPLREIARRLSEQYGVTISYTPSLGEEPIFGTFDQEMPVRDILATVSKALGARVRSEADGAFRIVEAE